MAPARIPANLVFMAKPPISCSGIKVQDWVHGKRLQDWGWFSSSASIVETCNKIPPDTGGWPPHQQMGGRGGHIFRRLSLLTTPASQSADGLATPSVSGGDMGT